jgi:signal peptidase I
MIPTLEVGQRVLVDRVSYHLSDPDIGDIVVFHPPLGADQDFNGPECGAEDVPDGDKDDDLSTFDSSTQPCTMETPERSDENFIKRIVAGPGDTLEVENGHPVVNGVKAEEDFIKPCAGSGNRCNLREPVTVPPDHYFMMGDNRGSSDDSRFWGAVPRDWIIGQAFLTYWPPDRIGFP